MKLAESTRDVLKNYYEIDPRLVYREGTSVWTQNMERSILAHAELEDPIPNDGFLYDISRLLGSLGGFTKDVDVEFHNTQIALVEGDLKANVTLSDPNMEPERVMERLGTDEWDDAQGTFRLKQKDLSTIMKFVRVYGLGHIAFHSDGSAIHLSAVDAAGEITDNATLRIADGNGTEFKHYLGVETIKLIESDYDVTLYKRGVSVFESANEEGAKLTYWIACEDVDE